MEAIAEAVRWLFRTMRTLRSYQIDNEMSLRALGEFTPRLGQVLPFSLELSTEELRWEATPLNDDLGSFPPLIADLYRDAQAVEVERAGDDPPERIAGWLATVEENALKGMDLQLLLDLLSIELDPLRWRDLAETVCSQIDALVQAGDLETACRVVEAVAHESEGVGRSHRPYAQAALERLASGSIMRHALGHLRSATDEGADNVKRLCTALGPVVVSPLTEVLSAEGDARARRRLRDILLHFRASRRAAIQQLLDSPNWEVRQTAAFLLREFAGAEGMPGLEALLNDSEPLVQREVIRALLLIGDERNDDVLVKALSANASRCWETLIQ